MLLKKTQEHATRLRKPMRLVTRSLIYIAIDVAALVALYGMVGPHRK